MHTESEHSVDQPIAGIRQAEVLAQIPFTLDMVETLLCHFKMIQTDGTAHLELTDHGLWIIHPIGARFFLGAADNSRDEDAGSDESFAT